MKTCLICKYWDEEYAIPDQVLNGLKVCTRVEDYNYSINFKGELMSSYSKILAFTSAPSDSGIPFLLTRATFCCAMHEEKTK